MLELLAIIGLFFLVKELDGPFGIIGYIRNFLMRDPFFGVFFYKLFSCPFCLGFHCGWIIYLISGGVQLNYFIIWGLAGAATNMLLSTLGNSN